MRIRHFAITSGYLRLLRHDSSGATLLEFALVLPFFLTLVFGLIQTGQMMWTQMALQHAVEMAARCASVNSAACGTATQIRSYAASQAYGLSLPANTFAPSTAACGNRVAATHEMTLPAFIFIAPSITLTAQSCYPRSP